MPPARAHNLPNQRCQFPHGARELPARDSLRPLAAQGPGSGPLHLLGDTWVSEPAGWALPGSEAAPGGDPEPGEKRSGTQDKRRPRREGVGAVPGVSAIWAGGLASSCGGSGRAEPGRHDLEATTMEIKGMRM